MDPAHEPPLVVGAALVDDLAAPTHVLAARRGRGALAGWWEFPGGKVEPGESPERALLRELAEELDLHAVVLGRELDGPEGGWPLPGGAHLRVWWASTTEPLRPGADHDELRWVGAGSVLQVPWLVGDLPLARRLAGGWLTPPRGPRAV